MCLNPKTIKVPYADGYRFITVPCRHCIECLQNKHNESTVRIVSELQTCGGKACFLTLTYSDRNLPYVVDEDTGEFFPSLCKKDIVDWLKRFRSNLDYKNSGKIRVSYCGEYGSKTYRPHAHVIVYGKTVQEIRSAIKDWNDRYGYVYAENVNFMELGSTSAVGRYLAKYASKGVFSDDMPIFKGAGGRLIERPFFRNSLYLGFEAFKHNFDYYIHFSSNKIYKTYADYLQSLYPFFTVSCGNASLSLPRAWRAFALGLKTNKRLKECVQRSVASVVKAVPSLMGKVPSKLDYQRSMDVVNDRFFVERVRSFLGRPSLSEEDCLFNVDIHREFMEIKYSRQQESARSKASKLCGFYALSRC